MKAKYVVGPTATPTRRDGHHPIIYISRFSRGTLFEEVVELHCEEECALALAQFVGRIPGIARSNAD
jgi:hypothetical protein